jgi:hypothetical protein
MPGVRRFRLERKRVRNRQTRRVGSALSADWMRPSPHQGFYRASAGRTEDLSDRFERLLRLHGWTILLIAGLAGPHQTEWLV